MRAGAASARSVVLPRGGTWFSTTAKGREARVQRRAVASRAAMSNSPGRSGNGAHERGAPPPVAPEGGAGLGIEVDQGGRAASTLEIGGHMDGQGGLAGAALLG